MAEQNTSEGGAPVDLRILSRGIVASRDRTAAAPAVDPPSSAWVKLVSMTLRQPSPSMAARNGTSCALRTSSGSRVKSPGGSTRTSRLTTSGRLAAASITTIAP